LIPPDADQESVVAAMQQNVSNYQRLDSTTCITEYGVDYLSSRRNVIVVVAGGNPSNSLVGTLNWSYNQPMNSWVCGATLADNMTLIPQSIDDFDCSIKVALSSGPWIMNNQSVEYCLSEEVPDICRLQFAVPIMAVVLSCNFVKFLCMIIAIWRCKDASMVTLGDAITSFLEKPDSYTRGMCIISKKEIEDGLWPSWREPQRWKEKRHFRCEAVGLRRWILSNAL